MAGDLDLTMSPPGDLGEGVLTEIEDTELSCQLRLLKWLKAEVDKHQKGF